MKSVSEIRLSKSSIGPSEKKAVMHVLSQEYLGMGQWVQKFETDLRKYFKRNVVCVNTGTSALQLALQALGIGSGDEVLVQSLTYVASFQAISATGATPIACEVNPDNFTIDLMDAQKKLSSRTKAIMPVHYSGGVGDLEAIYDFARKNNLRVIEDAAHALGSVYHGKKVGSFGDISCFSFDGIKNITAGEGGCIVTSDQKILQTVQDLRLLAVEKDTEKRYSGQRSWDFEVKSQGWRYHMSNVMAAIGISQLKRLSQFSKKRKQLAKNYVKSFNSLKTIKLLDLNYSEVLPHIFVIRVTNHLRDSLQEYLQKQKIQTGIHYKPNHLLIKYKSTSTLSVTEEIYSQILTLPLHFDLTLHEQKRVIKAVQTFFENHA